MAITPTSISNQALAQLPAGRITSLEENSVSALVCREHYAQVLAELIELGPWRFAIKRVVLAEYPANDRENEWLYAYSLPADAALLIRVLDSIGWGDQRYEYTGQIVYTNVPEAIIEYVTTADLAHQASALWRAALIARLAARVCMPITKNQKRALDLFNAAEVATERAQAHNHNLNRQNVEYMVDHVPQEIVERMGGVFDGRRLQGPEVNYPDFDPVGAFESEL